MNKNHLNENKIQSGEIKSTTEAQTSANETDNENFNFQLKDAYAVNADESEAEKGTVSRSDFKPESAAETVRKSGLAYAAGITLVGSIVVMLIAGWFIDRLADTSPWGIVGGIILGSVIGFYQFFRLTSQILKNKD